MHYSVLSLFVISVLWCWCMTQVNANDSFNKLFKLRGSIAQCRASCLENFVVVPATRGHPIKFNYDGRSNMDANNARCTSKTNWKCSMCWDYCESLAVYEHTRVQMCADDICLEGCQQACKFMQETSTSTSTTATEAKIVSTSVQSEKATKLKLAEPKVTKTGVAISWTMSPAKVTYAIFGLTSLLGTSDAAWEEIQQTAEHRLILPLDAKYEEILVAVFDSNGLVQKYNKKLVFQLRTKRSIENIQRTEITNRDEYGQLVLTLLHILFVVTFLVACAVSFVKLVICPKGSNVPVVCV